MTEKKVMHLITRFVGGGAESMTKDAVRALQKSEYDCQIFLGFGNEYDPELIQNIEKSGVISVSFQLMRHYNPLALLVSIVSVSLFLKRNDIDLLHTHSTEAGIVGRVAGKITGVPVIHSVHGVPFDNNNSRILNKMVELMERVSIFWANELVADSKSTRNVYLQRGIGTNKSFSIIPPAISISEFKSANPIAEKDNTFTFVFVGRLEKNKGVLDLLDGFDRVAGEDTELLIVGDGKLKNMIEHRIAESKNENNIELLGFRDDIPEIMNAGDALVLPTYREGFSITVTEALAAGLPVISTPVGAIPNKIEDGQNGYLIEPGNVDQLAKRMKQIQSGDLESRDISNAVQEYSEENVDVQYINLYRSYLGGHNE